MSINKLCKFLFSLAVIMFMQSCDEYLVDYGLPHGYRLSSLKDSGAGLTLWTPSGEAVVPKYWEEGAVIEIAKLAIVGDIVVGEVWNRKTNSIFEYFVFNTLTGQLITTKSKSEWSAALTQCGIPKDPPLREGSSFR